MWHNGIRYRELTPTFHALGASVGLSAYRPERLSCVDFTFDYFLLTIDFDEDGFVSAASKDNQHRKNRKIRTFSFGEDDINCLVITNATFNLQVHDTLA